MNSLGNKIKTRRQELGLDQVQLAKRAGISQPTLANLESGKNKRSKFLPEIAQALGMSLAELMQDEPANLPLNYTPVIEHDPDNKEFAEIRKVKLRLSAGITGFDAIPDIEDGRPITFRKEWLIKKGYAAEKLIAIGVKGESMEPTMSAGDTVVINIADTVPKDGKTYAVNLDGEAVIKRMSRRFGRWFLVSDNPDQARFHPHECTQGNCIVIGRVVMLQREDF